MSVEVRAQDELALASVKAIYDAAEQAQSDATRAKSAADEAEGHAQTALTNAATAQGAAEAAQSSANSANNSANAALTQLGIVEDVVDVLNWISEHGTYKASTDTAVVQGKYYFTRSGTSPNYTYTVVANPTGNPSTQGYYELDSVDEAVSNYISSHLALTNQGLWVINDNNSYKILLASDGMYVYNPSGTVVGRYGSTAQIGANGTTRFVIDAGKLQAYDSSGNKYFEVSASGLTFGSYTGATTSDIPTKVSDLNNDSGYQTASDVSGTIVSTTTLYYASNSTTPPSKPSAHITTNSASTYGAWNIALPTYSASYPYLYVCTETKTKGGSYAWTSVEQTTYASAISSISSTASDAYNGLTNKADKSSAVASTVSVYYRSTTHSAPSISTSTSIGTSTTTDNAWEYTMPVPKKNCYFYTCERYTMVDGSVSFSTVRELSSETYASKWVSSADSTYIDGGSIYANSVTANQMAANSITIGNMDSSTRSQVENSALVDEKTATGSIVSVTDASPYLAIDVQTDIEPIQDLHGYDKPWVGGAGKNKCPFFISGTDNGITFTVDAQGVITANGTATAAAQIRLSLDTSTLYGDFYFNGAHDGSPSTYNIYVWDMTTNSRVKKWNGTTNSDNGYQNLTEIKLVQNNTTYIVCRVMSGQTVNNVKFYPMIVASSVSDATYEPYSNICPISGRTEVDTHRAGKNLFKFKDRSTTIKGVSVSTNGSEITFTGTPTGAVLPYSGSEATTYANMVVDIPAGTYHASCEGFVMRNNADRIVLHVVDETNTPLTGFEDGRRVTPSIVGGAYPNITFTTTKPMRVGVWIYLTAGSAVNFTATTQLELGSTATAYEPYQGNTYTTALGRTVYGGTLDVTSGVLTVDRAMVDLGTLNWTYTANAGIKFRSATALPNVKAPATSSEAPNAICSAFEVKPYAQTSGNYVLTIIFEGSFAQGQVWCNDSNYTDAASFKTAMSGVQLVYELATPQTYNLTAQEIELLQGTNNVWTNCGNTTLQYAVLNADMLALAEQTGKSNKFITQIGSDGIKVHAEDNINQNYAKIDATGMEVYKGGAKVAKFGQNIELSDGTKTLYEVITSSGAVKVTRLYNRAFGELDSGIPNEDVIALGRTIGSGLSIKLNYKVNSTSYTATYTSLPVSVFNNSKFLFECSLSGTDLTVQYGAGETLSSSETLTIVSVVISFTTTQVLAESTLGVYADKTQTGVMRIGNGTADNAKSNAMLVDFAGNIFCKGEIYTGCNPDSTGGVRATKGFEYDGYYSEGSNYEISLDVYRAGAVVELKMWASRPVSIASGSNLFFVSLAGTPIPVPANDESVTGCSFYGAHILPMSLAYDYDADVWRFVVRNASSSAVTASDISGTLTYITDGRLMKDL